MKGERAHLGDQQNTSRNSLESYEVILITRLKAYQISLLWNSIFEDGAGQRLGNTPYGRYGIFIEDTSRRYWVQVFMYELYHNDCQSNTSKGPHKYDDYTHNQTLLLKPLYYYLKYNDSSPVIREAYRGNRNKFDNFIHYTLTSQSLNQNHHKSLTALSQLHNLNPPIFAA